MQQNAVARIPQTPVIAVDNGDILTYNANRVMAVVQNLSTDKLYLKFGSGCNNSNFSVILPGGSSQDDGFGASQDIGKYTGVVSIFSDGTVRAVATEINE